MELNPLNLMKGAILYKEYKIKKKFRNNNLLQVYLAENINTKELFFIKFEKKEEERNDVIQNGDIDKVDELLSKMDKKFKIGDEEEEGNAEQGEKKADNVVLGQGEGQKKKGGCCGGGKGKQK